MVLFERLLSDLDEMDIQYEVLDSNSLNYSNKFAMYIKILARIFGLKGEYHISMHGTASDYIYIAPFFIIRKFFFNNSYSLRKFAGSYDVIYRQYGVLRKSIISSVLRNSEVNFFESKYLVSYFKEKNNNTKWFPNVREKNNFEITEPENNTYRFVYLAQISREKGILQAIDAINIIGNELDGSVSLDIYGPLVDVKLKGALNSLPDNIKYHGVIEPNAVSEVLSNYHGMIFPTYYEGEGYPGVIIEAFSVGLPVISSHWKAIPELISIDDLLVRVKNTDDICKSILYLIDNFSRCSDNAKKSFHLFETRSATSLYLKEINFN